MREFEKWIENELSFTDYSFCEMGWNAALEMVRNWASGRRFNEEDLLIMLYKELKANE